MTAQKGRDTRGDPWVAPPAGVLGRGASGNPARGRVHRPDTEQTGTPVADPTTPGTEPTQDEPTQDTPEPSHEHGHDSPDHYPTEDDPA